MSGNEDKNEDRSVGEHDKYDENQNCGKDLKDDGWMESETDVRECIKNLLESVVENFKDKNNMHFDGDALITIVENFGDKNIENDDKKDDVNNAREYNVESCIDAKEESHDRIFDKHDVEVIENLIEKMVVIVEKYFEKNVVTEISNVIEKIKENIDRNEEENIRNEERVTEKKQEKFVKDNLKGNGMTIKENVEHDGNEKISESLLEIYESVDSPDMIIVNKPVENTSDEINCNQSSPNIIILNSSYGDEIFEEEIDIVTLDSNIDEMTRNEEIDIIEQDLETVRPKSSGNNQVFGDCISPPYIDHGYCKSDSPLGDNNSFEQSDNSPERKKIRLESVSIQTQTNVHNPTSFETHRQRMESCPPLDQEHIDLMLSYLENPKLFITEELFLMQLKLSKFPRIKRYSVARQLDRWSKYFVRRKINGGIKLLLRLSGKIILPREKYVEVIRGAHEDIGIFMKEKSVNCDPTQHNSYHKTFCMIESKFGVGGREFGMSKYNIYEYVANCKECSPTRKRLPSLSKVLGSSEVSKNMLDIKSLNTDNPSFGNVYTDISGEHENDGDAPISMLWDKPSPGSIWHNQRGLASETDPYSKLLGVIQEIGLDLTAASQGDNPSKSKFLTKLYCAVRLIQEMKTSCEKSETIADIQFMIEYIKLQELYIEMGKLDLFLYDINMLAIKYNLTKSELFMQIVNSCVAKISQIKKPEEEKSIFDTPIDIPEHLIDNINHEEATKISEL